MSVNNKANNITLEDLLEAGKNMGVKRSKCLKSIEEVKTSIANFEKYANEVGIKQETISYIKNIIKITKLY